MTRFIQQSACEGRRPHGVVPDRLRSRPRLLSRLLEDRGALRLVVAPPGFGKATLAFEYASVMFQFEHVFWLRGSSPCFLRDLDAGVLAEAVLEADEHAALMVVTDLPLLTDDRAEAFAEVVERLADANCEVIATTTRADAPMELFGRRVVIGAAEMLVAREDLEEEPEGVTDRRPLGLAERIAALRWGSATPIQLVLGASRAGCTPEEELALWAMTVLGRGTIDDVRALLGARRAEKAWDALAARCPLVGISAGEESFAALSVSLGEVRDHGRARLQALAETCGFAGREEAMEVLAERLMERGECGRAVSAMTLLARRRAHGRWLAANGWAALWGGAAVEVCELYDSATRTQMAARADINAMIAWAWAQRGDRARADQFAQRSLVSERSTPRTVLSAALAAWEVGNAATRRAMEETVASCLAELDGAGGVEREDGLAELVVVAHGVLALGRGDDVLAVWASRVGEALDWGSGSRIDVERRLLGAAAALEGLERPGRWAPAPIRPLPADPSWCGSSLAAIAPWTRWWSAAGASASEPTGRPPRWSGRGRCSRASACRGFPLPCPPHYLRLMSRRGRPARAARSLLEPLSSRLPSAGAVCRCPVRPGRRWPSRPRCPWSRCA